MQTEDFEPLKWWQLHRRLRQWRSEEQQHCDNDIEMQLRQMSGGQQLNHSKPIQEGKEPSDQAAKPSTKGEQQSNASNSGGKQPEKSKPIKEEKSRPRRH